MLLSKHYENYFWKDGFPNGIKSVNQTDLMQKETYKIVTDPYRKRVSIEKYINGLFSTTVYDSLLFDFRHLKAANQTAWQKIILSETPTQLVTLIRDQDDRAILIETSYFDKNYCRECRISSIHGHFLSIHRLFYTALNDSFDGVILFDQNEHPVMLKRYEIDKNTGEFAQLKKEIWNMELCQSLNF